MVITFTAILIGLLALLRPLQKNSFYILHSALVILSAYYIETHYFKCTPFAPKTFMLFVVFQLRRSRYHMLSCTPRAAALQKYSRRNHAHNPYKWVFLC